MVFILSANSFYHLRVRFRLILKLIQILNCLVHHQHPHFWRWFFFISKNFWWGTLFETILSLWLDMFFWIFIERLLLFQRLFNGPFVSRFIKFYAIYIFCLFSIQVFLLWNYEIVFQFNLRFFVIRKYKLIPRFRLIFDVLSYNLCFCHLSNLLHLDIFQSRNLFCTTDLITFSSWWICLNMNIVIVFIRIILIGS